MRTTMILILLSATLLAQDTTYTTETQKVSYSVGHQIGTNLKQQGAEFDIDAMTKGLQDGMNGTKPAFSAEEMRTILTEFQTKMRDLQRNKMKEAADRNISSSKAYLEANKAKEGVKTTVSGLQYKVIKEGQGEPPKKTDKVSVHYTGRLIDGTVFDSSVERGQPADFPVGGVIKGWTEALLLMKPGAKWELTIPSDLAYGERGAGAKIPPNAALIFDVELLEIK